MNKESNERFNDLIEYIEENLLEEISYKKLSQILGVNEYTMHRIFLFVTNYNLAEYIRKSRLSMSSLDLIEGKQRIIDIAIGATSKICIEPKDILKEAIRMEMPKIIIVHNHPSGDERASLSDIEMTKRVQKCAQLFGIQLIDHIIIGDGTFESILSKIHEV